MLTPLKSKSFRASGASVAIIASRYNARYVDAMVRAAQAELKRSGVKRVQVVRVPGAYEIPVVAARLARLAQAQRMVDASRGRAKRGGRPTRSLPQALVCLGVIFRGQTAHAAHIGEAVSRGLMEIQLRYEVPVVHEVLLLENEEQARVRCLGRRHNRGAEAAQTAVAMAKVMRELGADAG